MANLHWIALMAFVCAIEAAALYGLSLSGHFPEEHRPEKLRHGWGAALLWGTAALTALSVAAAFVRAAPALPWPALVIGAGAPLLFAPLLLRPLPDSFVNGRRALVVFSLATAVCAGLLWRLT